MARKLIHIPEHIDGADFGDILGKYFNFRANEPKINRNIRSGVLSQVQCRKYYRQLVVLVNKRIVLDEKMDKLRKKAHKIHDVVNR